MVKESKCEQQNVGKRYYKLHQIEVLRPIYNINRSTSPLVFLLEMTSTYPSPPSNFSMYLKCKYKFQSRNKCLISKLSCQRCYTYTEGKEEMFKIRIRFTMIFILQVTAFPVFLMFFLMMKEQKRSGRQNSDISSPSEL